MATTELGLSTWEGAQRALPGLQSRSIRQVTSDLEVATANAVIGDGDAFRTLYAALAPRVCSYLALRGADDAEGLTNEVFIQVLPRLATLKGGWSGLQALVFTVAHARAVDDVRRRTRGATYELPEDHTELRNEPSAEAQAIDRIGSQQLVAVLSLLPEEQQSVIALRVMADLSVEQTAAVMSKSASAVKKLQQRALAALRGLLAADGADASDMYEMKGLDHE